MIPFFDCGILREEHLAFLDQAVGPGRVYRPDLIIAPDGDPYLYRWHLIPRNTTANAYLHIQVTDDPERPLHDHPYDNCSIIIAGGYLETIAVPMWAASSLLGAPLVHARLPGDTIRRRAEEAHTLRLQPGEPYAMTIFTTGPRRRDWGFWFPEGWRSHQEVIRQEDNRTEFNEGYRDV